MNLKLRGRYGLTGLGFTLVMTIATLALFGLIGWGTWATCVGRADLYGLTYDWGIITGCNVLVDGDWQAIDNIRVHIQP